LWFFTAFLNLRHKRTIDNLPTSKTQGVFIGLAELKGTAESEVPLVSYLAGSNCIYYSWKVEEHWSRTVTETYRDGKGHVRTRTRTESGWKTVGQDSRLIPFYIKDETGILRIVPEGAKIQANTVFNQTCNPGNALYFEKGPAGEVSNSTHQRRFTEAAIPLHAMLYVLGQARERQDIVAAEIAQDKAASMFIISTRSEKQISTGYSRWFWFWFALGLLISAGSGAGGGWLAGTEISLIWRPIVEMLIGYLLLLLITYIWTTYNSFINLHLRVEQAWSQVEVQLKRRNDLIPNLIKVVDGFRLHESETQKVIAELRKQAEATPPGVKGPDFRGLWPVLQITFEHYPELQANQSFLNLQHSLTDTEQRIALARDYYNEIATFMNNRLEMIPDRYVAILARLHSSTLMGAADFERAPVNVNLAK